MSGFDTTVTLDEKRRFAEEWLFCADPRKAALKVFCDRATGVKMWLADHLPNDEETLKVKQQLLDERGGEEAFLPLANKAAFARKILEIVDEEITAEKRQHAARDRLKGLQLYGETMGFIEPRGGSSDAVVDVNVNDILKQLEPKLPG